MPKTLDEVVNELFGVKVRAVEDEGGQASIGTSAVLIIPNNNSRLGLVITNLSVNTLYLAFKNAVSSTFAFAVLAQGESAILLVREDFNSVGWAIWAVASGAASAVHSVSYISY